MEIDKIVQREILNFDGCFSLKTFGFARARGTGEL